MSTEDPERAEVRPRTIYLIGRLDRIVRRALAEHLRSYGLSVPGYTALTVLAARPGLSNAQLARRSFMTPQGMNQTVAVLAGKDLIRRTPATDNRRVQQLELTDAGRRIVAQCSVEVERFERDLLAPLKGPEQEQLNALLHEVVNANRQS